MAQFPTEGSQRPRFSPTGTINPEQFAVLSDCQRIWAVSSIHGEGDRLRDLHRQLLKSHKEGDHLVYLGNYLGRGSDVRDVIDQMLAVRRELLSRPGANPNQIAYLRGAQEEMWQKLLQLQFAQNPEDILRWMVDQGIEATLKCYGAVSADGFEAARKSALALARWTNSLREAMHQAAGHDALISSLRRAAYTEDRSLLFVSAGLDPDVSLEEQGDVLWWGGGFNRIQDSYEGFKVVVRGFDRHHAGVQTTAYSATVDAGCGFGGGLLAACFDTEGRIVDLLEG